MVALRFVFMAMVTDAGVDTTFFRSGMLRADTRHPTSFSLTGDFVTVGHFKGALRSGAQRKCNAFACFPYTKHEFISRGQNDIFVAKFNSSRTLQWVRVAGGP